MSSFEKVSSSGIKNLQGKNYSLSKLTVVAGPNGSGKTAIMESVRLGATGRAEVGGTAKKIAMLLDSTAASVNLDGNTCHITGGSKNSVKHHAEVDTQGDMPVTVEDFFDLSAEKKFSLIGGNALAQNAARAEEVKAEIKRADDRLSQQPPVMPEPYDGKPANEIEERQGEISRILAIHRKALSHAKERAAAEEELGRKKGKLAEHECKLEELQSDAEKLVEAKIALEKSMPEQKKVPHLLRNCIGEETREILSQLSDEIDKIQDYLEPYGDVVARLEFRCPDGLMIPGIVATEHELHLNEVSRKLAKITNEINVIKDSAATVASHVRQAERVLEQSSEGLLSDDEFEQLAVEHAELILAHSQALAWKNYDAACAKDQVERSKLANRIAELEQEQEELRDARVQMIHEIKGPLEQRANEMLARVGLSPLEVTITTTPKTSSLSVESDGMDIAVMERSRRMLYGLCLLSAMHELSNAPCPVLLADCCAMSVETFDKCILALSDRKKGNVILEHWAEPSVDCHVIKVG